MGKKHPPIDRILAASDHVAYEVHFGNVEQAALQLI